MSTGYELVLRFRALASVNLCGVVLTGDPAHHGANWPGFDTPAVDILPATGSVGGTPDPSPLPALPSVISGDRGDLTLPNRSTEGCSYRASLPPTSKTGPTFLCTFLVRPRPYAGGWPNQKNIVAQYGNAGAKGIGLMETASDGSSVMANFASKRNVTTGVKIPTDVSKWYIVVMSGTYQSTTEPGQIDYREVGQSTWTTATAATEIAAPFPYGVHIGWGEGVDAKSCSGTWNVALAAGWMNKDDRDLVKGIWDMWG